MTQAKEELVRYRLDRALDTLEDARILASAERWNACLNRLYYACFYAVSALLLKHGLSSAKHAGVRGLFNKDFVMTGKVPKDMARTYNLLFEHRQKGDYADLVDYEQSFVMPFFPRVEECIHHIAALLKE